MGGYGRLWDSGGRRWEAVRVAGRRWEVLGGSGRRRRQWRWWEAVELVGGSGRRLRALGGSGLGGRR